MLHHFRFAPGACAKAVAAIALVTLGMFATESMAGIQVSYQDLGRLYNPPGAGYSRPAATADGLVIGYYQQNTEPAFAPVAWVGSPTNPVKMLPANAADAQLSAIDGSTIVGRVGYKATMPGGTSSVYSTHATIWAGGANSIIDLHTAGYSSTAALGAGGNQQVGYGSFSSGAQNAMHWNGSAASAVDLAPADILISRAWNTDGTHQVGEGYGAATGNVNHALLWSGTAQSMVDLHPEGYKTSSALGVFGTQQVGQANPTNPGNVGHAFAWNGTAASGVDLNPTDFTGSTAVDTNGQYQVGYGYGTPTGGYIFHALLWEGTAASATDLHSLLPANYLESRALSIEGNTIYGYGRTGPEEYHALVWIIPEPSSLMLLGIGLMGLLRRPSRQE